MPKLLSYFLLLFVIILTSCKKDSCDKNPENYRLHRVEYYDTTGIPGAAFKNLSYNGGLLTRIDMISGNFQILEYQNNKVVKFYNMLLGVPFPITSLELKYSATELLERVVTNSQDASGQTTQDDTVSFSWVGSKLEKVSSRAFRSTGQVLSEEKLYYTYSGDNIRKCVFEGGYYAYTAGPVYWKDSVEFQYDTLPNRFSENGISFFLQEFGLINKFLHKPLRADNSYFDPFWFDPAFFAFIQSKNNVVTMKSKGGANILHFNYIEGSGSQAKQVTEIRTNDRIVSRYFYKKY